MPRWLPRALGAVALVAVGAVLAVGALGSPTRQAEVVGGWSCPLLAATGHPCAFCGMTHATLALGRGDLHAALDAHPLAPLVLAGTVAIFALVAAGRADALAKRRRPALILAAIAVIWAVKLS